jgi:hypothetical protein
VVRQFWGRAAGRPAIRRRTLVICSEENQPRIQANDPNFSCIHDLNRFIRGQFSQPRSNAGRDRDLCHDPGPYRDGCHGPGPLPYVDPGLTCGGRDLRPGPELPAGRR